MTGSNWARSCRRRHAPCMTYLDRLRGGATFPLQRPRSPKRSLASEENTGPNPVPWARAAEPPAKARAMLRMASDFPSAGSLSLPGTLVRPLFPAKALAADGFSPPSAPCSHFIETEGTGLGPVFSSDASDRFGLRGRCNGNVAPPSQSIEIDHTGGVTPTAGPRPIAASHPGLTDPAACRPEGGNRTKRGAGCPAPRVSPTQGWGTGR
jgi:hypothetical protein